MNQVQMRKPYGYHDDGSPNVDEQIVINHICILRSVFEWSFEAIARQLNEDGEVFPRGPRRRWTRADVAVLFWSTTKGADWVKGKFQASLEN